jgi:hypothetical protein
MGYFAIFHLIDYIFQFGSSLIPVARIRKIVQFQGYDNTRKIV